MIYNQLQKINEMITWEYVQFYTYKLYKPGSSTKQFLPKLAKKLKFWKMILSSQPQIQLS